VKNEKKRVEERNIKLKKRKGEEKFTLSLRKTKIIVKIKSNH